MPLSACFPAFGVVSNASAVIPSGSLMTGSEFIATPRHSKHRHFIWLDAAVLANDSTIVFARDDDYYFGVLHSRIHEVWARAQGTQVREEASGARYTPTTSFETFPLPGHPDRNRRPIRAMRR